jgi:PhnB protein
MARVSTYLNFDGKCEEAFLFYKSVFGTEFSRPFMKFKDLPAAPGQAPLPPGVSELVINVALPLPRGHVLMGADAPSQLGMTLVTGNNVHLTLELDTRAETRLLFASLGAGGTVRMELQDQFWGDYYGQLQDRYGVWWMFNCHEKA